ncbi:hypothetical protein PP714_10985 [Lacticaseibacillus paracasei]|nr:hypothetical protein [Lacticaseibacillus paracasei]
MPDVIETDSVDRDQRDGRTRLAEANEHTCKENSTQGIQATDIGEGDTNVLAKNPQQGKKDGQIRQIKNGPLVEFHLQITCS